MPSLGVRSAAVLLLALFAASSLVVWSEWRIQPGWGQPVAIGCTECPPFQDNLTGSPLSHFALEVMVEAARRIQLPIRFVKVTGSARSSLRNGQADIWPRLTLSAGDEDHLFFSEPWVAMSYCVLSRRGWQSHPGAKVAVTPNLVLEPMVRHAVPGAELIHAPSGKLLEQVCSGQADAAFIESRVLSALLLKDRDPQCDGIQFQTAPSRDLAVPASIAARPSASWAARLLRNEIGRMAADGSLASLHAKWFLVTSVETGAFDQLHSTQRDLLGVQWLAFGFAGLVALMLLQTYRLKKFRVNAQRATGLKTRFVANVSHELRTPLSGIVGLVDMLSDTRMTAHQTELLRVVRSTALSLGQVINDLLDVAKVEAGQLEIRKTSFELGGAVEEVCAMMAGRAAGKGTRLQSTLDPGLPQRVHGDATRLRELLMNLLGNAMQYTDHGEVRLAVAVDQATPFQWMIAFTVTDTGVGIPSDDLARLFQDFELDSEPGRKPVRRGSGLGLAIGKRLVDLLGGTIAVESPRGVGARFRFVLPFDVARADGEPEPQPETFKPVPPLFVLLCEDDTVHRRVTIHMLNKLSHQVEAVANGADAVDAASKRRFDLVLMDCQLPDIDGYDAARMIRAEGASAGVPVLALSAITLAEDRRRCEEAGMEGFLAKPLSMAALSEALAKLNK